MKGFEADYEIREHVRTQKIPAYVQLAKLVVDEACKQRYGQQP